MWLFINKKWYLYGPEIFTSANSWLQNGSIPPEIISTTIVLIPKNQNPTTTRDFRFISLCNVIHKIISKTLVYKLKLVLGKCISKEQSTFVEWRSILDNVLVATEIIHHMKCKNKGKSGEMTLKIDVNKAFEKIELNYLLSVMTKMGFHQK